MRKPVLLIGPGRHYGATAAALVSAQMKSLLSGVALASGTSASEGNTYELTSEAIPGLGIQLPEGRKKAQWKREKNYATDLP